MPKFRIFYTNGTVNEKITIRIGPEDCSQVRLTRDHELVIRTDGNPACEIVMDESLLDRLIVAASENPWLTEEQEPVTPDEAAQAWGTTPAKVSDWLTPEQRLRYGPALFDSTVREALRIAVTATENDRQAERFEAALAAMDHEEA